MSTFDPISAAEGALVVEGDVQDNFDLGAAAVNGLESGAIKPRSLGTQHLPSLVLATHSFAVDWAGPLDSPSLDFADHHYTVRAVGPTPIQLGAYPGFDGGVAAASRWFVIGGPDNQGIHPPPTTQVSFAPQGMVDLGLLIQLNVEMSRALLGYTDGGSHWGAARRPVFAVQMYLEVPGGVSGWYTIRQSIRFVAHNPVDTLGLHLLVSNGGEFQLNSSDLTPRSPGVDVALTTLIRRSTVISLVGSGEAYVTGIRAVVSVKGGTEEPTHPGDRVHLGRFSFSCTAMQSKVI